MSPTPAAAADRLVGLANAAGGDDNVTVIVIDPDRLVEAAADVLPVEASPPTGTGEAADDRRVRDGLGAHPRHGSPCWSSWSS